MLLLNHKMAATEAWENGLVMEVLKPGNFMEQVDSRVKALAAMPNKVNVIITAPRVCGVVQMTLWDDVLLIGEGFCRMLSAGLGFTWALQTPKCME